MPKPYLRIGHVFGRPRNPAGCAPLRACLAVGETTHEDPVLTHQLPAHDLPTHDLRPTIRREAARPLRIVALIVALLRPPSP
ncbi:hypothetical protein [Poseidonocella sedimentorum]|uniref:hypothetical protein n=1 Tax=Poseidonocella sedimentorum TaxID=871652 RepID=UPI00116054AD|nr:hypothetical protein [Poseidonocella sedimentorum]